MQQLLRIITWRSSQPAVIRWFEALALFGIALCARFSFGTLHGGMPALTFYPVILIVAVLVGWQEALAVLGLSVIAGLYLFLPADMYLLPVGWVLVGTLTIAIIAALKAVALELAKANERQRVLLQELQHRVANTLRSVASTLELVETKAHSAPAEATNMLKDVARRISASANVHRRLNDPAFFQSGLKPILQEAVASVVDQHSTHVSFDVEDLKLSLDQMSMITMLVIEIASSSQKDAIRRPDSHFLVGLRALPGDRAVLSVKDDGPSLCSSSGGASSERALGMDILHGLTNQLHGTLSVKSDSGTEVALVFPKAP